MLKSTIYGILGVVLSILFIIVCLEIILQIGSLISPNLGIYTQGLNPSSSSMEYYPITLWKIRPDVDIKFRLIDGDIFNIKTVDLGFSNIGFRDDGINESIYAIVLGDSFTFGAVNLSDTWVEKLEVKTGKDFINMGVPGYSTMQSEKLMEIYGKELMPKLVLVQFYYNDIEGNQLLTSKTREIRNWLLWNTKTYGIIRYYYYKIFNSPASTEINYNDAKFNFTFQPQLFPYKKTIKSLSIQQGVLKTEKSLLNIKDLSDSVGAEMVILIMPSKEQIYGHLIMDKLSNFNEINMDYYTDVIERFCTEKGIKCMNLVPTFREHGNNTQLFYSVDSHFNIYGNDLAAQKTYEFLQKENLLDLKS